jgi:hypothetical protein
MALEFSRLRAVSLPRSGTALSSWVLLALALGFRSYGVTVRQLVYGAPAMLYSMGEAKNACDFD